MVSIGFALQFRYGRSNVHGFSLRFPKFQKNQNCSIKIDDNDVKTIRHGIKPFKIHEKSINNQIKLYKNQKY